METIREEGGHEGKHRGGGQEGRGEAPPVMLALQDKVPRRKVSLSGPPATVPDELRALLKADMEREQREADEELALLRHRKESGITSKSIFLRLAPSWRDRPPPCIRGPSRIESATSLDHSMVFMILAPGHGLPTFVEGCGEPAVAWDKLAAEHRRRAEARTAQAEQLAAKHASDKSAARTRREKAASERHAAAERKTQKAAAKARKKAVRVASKARTRELEEEAAARERMRKVLEAEAAARGRDRSHAAQAKAMRDRWKAYQEFCRQQAAGGRETGGASTGDDSSSEDDDDDDDDDADADADGTDGGGADLEEWVTDEIRQMRSLKAAERDDAVKRLLASRSPTLEDALGIAQLDAGGEVARHVRKLLRLLHPDFGINQGLGGKHQRHVERAFKRLNGLWASAQAAG